MTPTEAREALGAVIEAAGLRVASPSGSIGQIPCVVIVGSEPWIVPVQLGSRRTQLNLEAVALVGGTSDAIAMETLEAMAVKLSRAIFGAKDWTLPIVHRPGRSEAQGQTYQSVRVSTSIVIADTTP